MLITVLGVGGMFSMSSYHANAAVCKRPGSDILLLDCGSDIRFSLSKCNLSMRAVTDVYVTHMHPDHCGGLPWLAFAAIAEGRRIGLHVATAELMQELSLFLQPQLRCYGGRSRSVPDYFDIHVAGMSGVTETGDFSLRPHKFLHLLNVGAPSQSLFSYGVAVTELSSSQELLYTGDVSDRTDAIADVVGAARRADVVLADCGCCDGVHAHASDWADAVACAPWLEPKLRLTHYPDSLLNDPDTAAHLALRKLVFVRAGDTIDTANLNKDSRDE